MIVYLLHLSRPFRNHARHYIGVTVDLDARLARHGTRYGARILHAAAKDGITWEVARTWNPGDRQLEIELKRQHNAARLCPVCKEVKP